jgi:beta-lactamase regulating signal transducer with metallopeptidase domain
MSLLTHSALLRALGWSLFNSLWQMSLLWATFHFFLLIFSRLPARSRHGLALFLLTVGAGWSLVTFLRAYIFPETVPHESQWLLTLLPAADIGNALTWVSHWLIGEALPWGSSVYLLVLSVLLLRYFRHYIRSRQITRTGLSSISPAFRLFTASTARQMGIRATVGIYLSSLVDVPVTLGFLKPVILLPVAILTNLRTEQVEAILVHELAHIQRKDYLLNLMITVIELLFFFNPFARLLIARIKKEREHCCDDQVLEFRYDPHAYVSALLSLARQHGQGRLALAAIGGGGDQLLLQRARTMLQQKKQYSRPGPRALCGLFLLLLLGMFSLGVSIGGSVDPARNTTAFSGDRVLDPASPQTPGMFMPVSMEATRVIKTPLVNIVAAEAHPMLITPVRGHTAVHHIARKPDNARKPAAADEYRALVLNTAGPDAEVSPAYIANSSFLFQYTDTLAPKAKLVWMEQMAERAFRIQVLQLQAGLRTELVYLRDQQANAQKAIMVQMRTYPASGIWQDATMEQLLKEFLQRQFQLQQEYQDRMDDLQQQWLKMGHRLTIVYI